MFINSYCTASTTLSCMFLWCPSVPTRPWHLCLVLSE